ncbi:MAG: hemolysin family protein [Gemmatimonadota bacterium]
MIAETPEATLGVGAIIWRLATAFLLVLANGFFVAAEFSLVGARRTRIDALVRKGSRPEKLAKHAFAHLDLYISATHLGITISSLALGWLGERTLATMFVQTFAGLPEPWDAIATHTTASAIAFAFITFLHIVLGELAPKSVALLFPETTSMWTAGPLIMFARIFTPFIKLLNGTANLLLRAVGLKAPTEAERVHKPEELEMLAMHAFEHGGLSEEPLDMIRGVFDLSERTVADVMTPRTRMVALPISATIEEAVDAIARSGHSRLPVFGTSPDDIKGYAPARDVWRAYRDEDKTLKELVRAIMFVPTTKDIESLLTEMRDQRQHLAIGVDEFGGTAGLVTIEDILEEIVGEIHDEHETDLEAIHEQDGRLFLEGTVSLFELNDRFGLTLPSHEFATIAGFVMSQLGRIAEQGDVVDFDGGRLEVVQLSGRRIAKLELVLQPAVEANE